MGTLGPMLREARTARKIDLREAAQQTRISLQYLQALEEEDFAKLPGEVFVKGFLKNYGKFLRLDETLVMQKYSELAAKKPAAAAPAAAAPTPAPPPAAQPSKPAPAPAEREPASASSKMSLEPFVWGVVIIAVLIAFLFAALPSRHGQKKETPPPSPAPLTALSGTTPTTLATGPAATAQKPEKLYLEVVALENTWVLVRTDSSPQKKAALVKGDTLTWSADERFIVSYGSAGAVKLVLNGKELTVDEPKNAVVRDLTIVASGVVNKKIKVEQPQRPAKPKPQTAPTGTVRPQERKPVQTKPTPTAAAAPATTPAAAPAAAKPQNEPVSREQRTVPQPMAPLNTR